MKKAFIAIKYYSDKSKKKLVESLYNALIKNNVKPYAIVSELEKYGQTVFDAKTLMKKTFKKIDTSDLVIVDLTEKGVGIGIEAGYAYAKNIPVFTIARTGSDVSKTLEGISKAVYYYKDEKALPDIFRSILF